MFGSKFQLRARFSDVNGLMEGNNVRFSGIQAGTVERITILNDTTIEVTLLINKKAQPYIRKNSFAVIGSEGLMGNKIINIAPNPTSAPIVEEGDLLLTNHSGGINDMLETLGKTNNNVAEISEDIKLTASRINNSKVIATLLNDTALSHDIRQTLSNFRNASARIDRIAFNMEGMIANTQKGRSTLGVLLADTVSAHRMKETIRQINTASTEVNNVLRELNTLTSGINIDLNSGSGVAYKLMKDSILATRLGNSMNNIEKGTVAFNEDMEALKHTFLLRRYFKRQARKQQSR